MRFQVFSHRLLHIRVGIPRDIDRNLIEIDRPTQPRDQFRLKRQGERGVRRRSAKGMNNEHTIAASGGKGGLGISALTGWYGSAPQSFKFGATDGDQTTGGDLSFGLPGSSNRALGLLATSSTKGTAFGVRFINGTASTLTRINLQVTGEVWRQSNVAKTLQFSIRLIQREPIHFPSARRHLFPH